MPVICPSITAPNQEIYQQQIDKIVHLAHRIQIDLTDGRFSKGADIEPEDAWWPVGFKADFHLMYHNPISAIKTILAHKPNLIIVHAEAKGSFTEVAGLCRKRGVKVGVALLPDTSVDSILPAINRIDHVLIFSGNLGEYGGHADLSLLGKAKILKQARRDIEIGWDGGVTTQNVSELIFGGVDVLNVGGFIQNAQDPAQAFHTLTRIADETQ